MKAKNFSEKIFFCEKNFFSVKNGWFFHAIWLDRTRAENLLPLKVNEKERKHSNFVTK